MPSTVLAWSRGGAVMSRPRPLASPGTIAARARFTAGPTGGSALFINSVVGHTRIIHLRVIRRPRGLRNAREVSGTLHIVTSGEWRVASEGAQVLAPVTSRR
jgi:hypothetical protein